jgi:uncharacterized protein (DUF302 family)
VVAKSEAAIAHPDMGAFRHLTIHSGSYAELGARINKMVGDAGLMEFTRFDIGQVLRKALGTKAPTSLRFVVGNPLIMEQMVEHVPDAAAYAPVTILIDKRPGGVRLSYDRMATFLSPYGNEEALKVARELDSKVERLLAAAAI